MANPVMLQSFEWETDGSGNFYKNIEKNADKLAKIGFTSIWLPPCTKATGMNDVGYGIYDLFDLGEFDQKGGIRTKYGTKDELLKAIAALHKAGIKVFADVVLNHKAGADGIEKVKVVEVDPENREKDVSGEHEIEAWTHFTFPGRKGKYSKFEWHWYHFSGIDYDNATGKKGIFKIQGKYKDFSDSVSNELGNYDYLMFADIDYSHPDVVEEVLKWQKWFIKETGVDGFRLDAVKHIDHDFMYRFISEAKAFSGKDFFCVGEYWIYDENATDHYLYETDYDMSLFDVRLHFNMMNISKNAEKADLRKVFDNTIVQEHPMLAVTFVDNHDSQPGQSLESWVEDWFKPSAYALILLRRDGYPCVFAGDYYGINGRDDICGHKDFIDKLMDIRKNYCYGDQWDFFQSEKCIGWARLGDEEHKGKMLAAVNIGDEAELFCDFGEGMKGLTFKNCLNEEADDVVLDENGKASFIVPAGEAAVWTAENTVKEL